MEPSIRRHPDAIGSFRGSLRRSEGPVSCGPVLAGGFGGSFGEELLVGDWRKHLGRAVAPVVVVGVDEPGDLAAGLLLGGEAPAGEQLVLEGRVEAFRGGVVQR